jgi:hypothetical protein
VNDPTFSRLYNGKVSITAKPPGDNVPWLCPARLMAAVHRADQGVDLPVAPDAGRRRQGEGLASRGPDATKRMAA